MADITKLTETQETNEKNPPKEKKFKITLNAPVTLVFAVMCLIATILITIFGDSMLTVFSCYRTDMSFMTIVRFFTHALGHSGWSHFIGNMAYILLLGPLLEEKYGSACMIEIMALTALFTGLVNFLIFPDIAILGASGIVFAFILLSSITGFKKGEIPLTFILVAVIYIGGQIYDGIALNDNISNMSHIIGGIVGAFCGFLLQGAPKK